MSPTILAPVVAPLLDPEARPPHTFVPSGSCDPREHVVNVPDLAIDMAKEINEYLPYAYFTASYAVCFFVLFHYPFPYQMFVSLS